MKTRRKLKVRFKKLFIISFFVLSIPFVSKLILDIFANPINYIYLDLNCADVVINDKDYSGCVYQTSNSVTSSVAVSGKHNENNHYYIYQSNDANKSITGYVNNAEEIIVPVYSSLANIVTGFIDNKDVEGVISTWREEASKIGRQTTINKISISGTSNFDITVDNIWSSYQDGSAGRTDGGISFNPTDVSSAIIRLKGENRVGNVFYANTNSKTFIEFTSIDGEDKDTGSLVVANIESNSKKNYYTSGIGGNDTGKDAAVGIKITGGTIYVGTTAADNCSAIGGGGNGKGGVTITGGIITAVSSSTGTAIGGGIGETSYGGDADISITGGTVYAYNMGFVYSKNGTFIPGAAIGGGSSRVSTGNKNTSISITGGTVYAESVGGVAIGGGNSATLNGGPATITIGGDADVVANSVEGEYIYDNQTYYIQAGSGVGGGTGGKTGNGGDATVNIIGGKIKSGTIGGGETNATDIETYSVGDANVTITDGEVIGRILMYTGSFNMSNGILTGGSSENGGCVQMYNGTATITGGEIKKCIATENGGAIYLAGGTFYSKGGKIYDNNAKYGAGIYIANGVVEMSSGDIESNNVELNGGGIYIGGTGNFKMSGGTISGNKSISGDGAGIYLTGGTIDMSNGSILNNEANSNGGGISIEGNGIFNMTGGKLNNNKSISGNGGGIYLTDGNVTIKNGYIENNEANSNGGGIYLDDGSIEMLSGYVSNNKTNLNGGGISIGGSGIFTMSGGNINNNTSLSGNGGGIYVANGNIIINDGNIKENKAISENKGFGGGICVASGNITMYDGNIEANEAINGGGFYLTTGTFEIKNGSLITKNKAVNGAGGYVQNGIFNLTGGTTSNNVATLNGGGYYIVDTTTASLSNGIIANNEAKNGGGFYQTQTSGNNTSTILSGTCYVNNNKANNGNGGGVYVDGGSTFRMISGKLIYNNATGSFSDNDIKTNNMVYAKDSSAGVGGGVYIKNGIFTMKNNDGSNGTSAIFGNIASYAADDLFAYGNGMTTFDAIPVITMEKDDAYLNSTDWFEDYPSGEEHKSLRIDDSGNYLISGGRYKSITSESLLVKADSVLATSNDYICITMGANVGSIILSIDDSSVGSDNIFLYSLVNVDSNMVINLSVKQGIETKVINLPIGNYKLTLNDKWSWRYSDKFNAIIKSGSETTTIDSANTINLSIVGGKTLDIDTKYNILNKTDLSKNIFTKIPLNYNLSLSEVG